MQRRRFILCAMAGAGLVTAQPMFAEPALLPAHAAFQIQQAVRHGDWIEVDLLAAPGYAIYAERIRFQTDTKTVTIAAVELPQGEPRWDEALGQWLTYLRGAVRARVRLVGPATSASLTVVAQGCADVGVCYPPVARTFEVRKVN